MEIYAPFIVYTSLSAFLGKKAYSYLTNNTNKEDIQDLDINKDDIQDLDTNKEDIQDLDINKDDYELININIKIKHYWKSLGIDFNEKSKSIKSICKDECGFEINQKKKNKERIKIIYYISEYEILGHVEFVNKFIKKWKLNKKI